MATELTRQLHALGATVDVGIFDNNGRGDRKILEVAAPYIHRGVVLPCRGQFDRSTIAALRQYIREQKIDVIHSHKYKTTFYALLARRGTGCRVVTTYHNWLGDTLPLRLYAALDKRLARFCDAAVGVSEPVTQELRRYVPTARAHYIGNGVDTDVFRRSLPLPDAKRALGLPENSQVLGFVGRLSAQKGISYLLRALATTEPADRADTHIVIVGDGEQRAPLTEEARALGLAERTHFLGTRHDTPGIYSAFDVFVLPSEVEAFPMVVLEAMSCEAPVVATDVGDVARIVDNGTTGHVVPVRDVNALREAFCKLLNDPATAQRMGRAGRERVAQHFSSTRMARTYLDLYGKLGNK